MKRAAPRTGYSAWELVFLGLLISTALVAVLLESVTGLIEWPAFLFGLVLLGAALLRPLTKSREAERNWTDAAVLVLLIAATHLLVRASGGGDSALYAFYFLPILAAAREYGLRGAILAGTTICTLYSTFFLSATLDEIEAELVEEIITLLFTSLLAGYLFEKIEADQASRREAMAARRLADIGLLASQVAHELRNPLQVIEGAAETIEEHGWIDAKGRPFLEDLRREARRVSRLAGDFLAWGRPSIRAGEEVPLRALLDRAHHRAGATPSLELSGDLETHLLVDADAMERALANLFQNAAQAGANRLWVRAAEGDREIELEIGNDGPGIPGDLAPVLFEPFRSGRRGGTGLGLAIVRGIIEGHGGSIALDSIAPPAFRLRIPFRSATGEERG